MCAAKTLPCGLLQALPDNQFYPVETNGK